MKKSPRTHPLMIGLAASCVTGMNTEKSEIGQASGFERDWKNGMESNLAAEKNFAVMSICRWFKRRLVERGAQASPFQRRRHEDSHCYIDFGGWIDGFGICCGCLGAGDER